MTALNGLQENQNKPAHIPVMLDEVLRALKPATDECIVDGTFGAGGYSRAILETGANVLAIDRDPNAIRSARGMVESYDDRLNLQQGSFSELLDIATKNGIEVVDGVVLDVGVSSMQLDQAERGFSFSKDGPLDMRMGQNGVSAADVVNQVSRTDLTRIIGILGEEKKASQVSAAIDRVREKGAITSTLELSKLIEKTLGKDPKSKIHPATKTFQALRIFVNRELEELAKVLFAAEQLLRAGGRLAVVTFHSLEDRIVKQFFADRSGAKSGSRHLPEIVSDAPTFELQKRGPIKASDAESAINPRSRSAKLRWGVRTGAVSRAHDFSMFGFPNLVSLDSLSDALSYGGRHA